MKHSEGSQLWAVLQAKAEGEALQKDSAVKDGEGLWACIKMHQWFMKTTDLGKQISGLRS